MAATSAEFGPLVDTNWLEEHLDHSPLRVADCRWYLADPELGGRRAYEAGHIPGARYISIDTHLSASSGPGRHPLPAPEQIAESLGTLGIGDRNYVVAYDDAGGSVAARLWWMLRSIGHKRIAVLDGGIRAWTESDGRLETEQPPAWLQATLTVRGAMLTVERSGLAPAVGQSRIIDARAPERYRGDSEPIDLAAGHIPSAINVPADRNLDAQGRLLAPAELRALYNEAGVSDAAGVVVYCGSGVTACHDILAMEVAGMGSATLYPGSWSDWSSAGGRVATGPEPGEL